MNDRGPPAQTRSQIDVDVNKLLGSLARHRLLIAGFCLAGMVGGLAFFALATPVYRSSALLAPVSAAETSAPNLGAGLLGFGMQNDQTQQSIALLSSRFLAERFIGQHELKPILFAERWDAERRAWLPPSGIGPWVRWLKSFLVEVGPPKLEPSAWDAAGAFDEVRTVQFDQSTGLITLSMEWREAKLAAAWARAYVVLANEVIRQQARAEAAGIIDQITAKMAETQNLGTREMLVGLLAKETSKLMVATVREEYALRVIDPPVAPDDPAWPKGLVLLLLGLIGGGLAGAAAALFVERRRGRARGTSPQLRPAP
jgi:uncharacterized protein involved in exopolysaccharide biosynthesis